MSSLIRNVSLVLLAGMIAALSAPMLRAADAPAGAKGSIKGVVYDVDHKPLADVEVHLFTAGSEPEHKPSKTSTGAARLDDTPATKPAHPKPLMEAKTDSTGAFTFSDVPAGEYGVYASLKKVGRTHAKVAVTAGAAATVELTIKPHAPKPA